MFGTGPLGPRFAFKKTMARINKQLGFTVIELVVVIVLLGILAAFALPRFFDVDSFRTRADYDEIAGAVRYAQKLAVASGCDVQVQITSGGYALQQHATNCTTGAFTNISGHPITNAPISGVSLPTRTLEFDAMGRCTSGAGTFSIGGENITVVAETGYVDAP